MKLRSDVVAMVLAVLTSACAGDTGTTSPNASVTLSAQQATQPEQIFFYACSAHHRGDVPGTCPPSGGVYANYTAIYNVPSAARSR